MKWSAMNKEQRQKAVLAVIIAAAVLYGGVQFAVLPLLSGLKNGQAKRDELLAKIEKAQRTIRAEGQIEASTTNLQSNLSRTFAQRMPPMEDALSWATKFVNEHTRRLGLSDPSVAEASVNDPAWKSNDQSARSFLPYGIRVELSANFEEVQKLVRSLHDDNPYLSVAGIVISADSAHPEKHFVELLMEWPIWKDAAQAKQPFAVKNAPAKE